MPVPTSLLTSIFLHYMFKCDTSWDYSLYKTFKKFGNLSVRVNRSLQLAAARFFHEKPPHIEPQMNFPFDHRKVSHLLRPLLQSSPIIFTPIHHYLCPFASSVVKLDLQSAGKLLTILTFNHYSNARQLVYLGSLNDHSMKEVARLLPNLVDLEFSPVAHDLYIPRELSKLIVLKVSRTTSRYDEPEKLVLLNVEQLSNVERLTVIGFHTVLGLSNLHVLSFMSLTAVEEVSSLSERSSLSELLLTVKSPQVMMMIWRHVNQTTKRLEFNDFGTRIWYENLIPKIHEQLQTLKVAINFKIQTLNFSIFPHLVSLSITSLDCDSFFIDVSQCPRLCSLEFTSYLNSSGFTYIGSQSIPLDYLKFHSQDYQLLSGILSFHPFISKLHVSSKSGTHVARALRSVQYVQELELFNTITSFTSDCSIIGNNFSRLRSLVLFNVTCFKLKSLEQAKNLREITTFRSKLIAHDAVLPQVLTVHIGYNNEISCDWTDFETLFPNLHELELTEDSVGIQPLKLPQTLNSLCFVGDNSQIIDTIVSLPNLEFFTYRDNYDKATSFVVDYLKSTGKILRFSIM
ncbi:hypothetical protein RCL1_004427 [Eukaryota sp. TZLM3-RCL]